MRGLTRRRGEEIKEVEVTRRDERADEKEKRGDKKSRKDQKR